MAHGSGSTEFNLAARIDTPDMLAEKTIKSNPVHNVTGVKHVAEPAVRSIPRDFSNIGHNAEVAGDGLRHAGPQVSMAAELFGAITKTVSEFAPALGGPSGMEPDPALETAQEQVADLDTLAAQRAAEAEIKNTTWTDRSNNMEYKMSGGPGGPTAA